MRALFALLKMEMTEQLRSGRLMLLAILFLLLGIMNPAIAKLTPWLFEMMTDSLADSGIAVTTVTVDAMTSWAQFFKNIPMGLIAFVLLESSIFTREYQSGTLVLTLTKGVHRYKTVISKAVTLTVLWSICYWLCFAITYGYNAYYWDNGAAQNLAFSVVCWWLLGLWAVMLTVLFSSIAKSNTGVLAGTAGAFLAAYLIGLLPRAKAFSPSMLMDTAPLLAGAEEISSYGKSITVIAVLCVVALAASIPVMDKRQL